ncbi:gamma-aminobutyric acid type B receptor subunit 1-like [Mya arenaria]|uniref:gamma-aminobutyric acid type B receptor subunit 1-like n=1 Tax=Mya arenaria TaxID=6604 RepID=UPI0022E1C31E|nr:gamma-aminobutyric acid type B receptor subunit 1-like [Mya arenaria]
MLLGSACSSASESTAEVSHYYNITQLAYAASSPILSDRERFRKFFRLSAPDTTMIPTRIDIMRTFNWKKIATIHEALEFFSVSMDDFIKDVQKTDIEIISQEVFVHDPFDRVKNLKDRDARIIVAGMYEDKARMVLCAAYKVGLFGPKIVWILQGWFSEVFWKQGLESISCTAEELSQVAEGVFLIRPVFNNPIEERGIANMTNSEFMQRYLNHPEYSKETQSYDLIAAQCYDHIWLAALALNCADERLKTMVFNETKSSLCHSKGSGFV